MPRRIVDAHHHLWDLSVGRYAWQSGRTLGDDASPFDRNYLISDFRRDAEDLEMAASVHVEAAWIGKGYPVAESAWLSSIIADSAIPVVHIAYAELEKPAAEEQLDRHLAVAPVRGVRQMLDWDPRTTAENRFDLMSNPDWLRGLSLLASRNLTFDLQIAPEQMEQASEVVDAFPEVTFILNHGGLRGPLDERSRSEWVKGIKELSRRPNTVAKASGFENVEAPWNHGAFKSFLRRLLDNFGPSRVMFGSNFPIARTSISYRELVASCESALRGLTAAEQHMFFSENAQRVYRIGQ